MPCINWAEARRYLGYLREQPDEAVEQKLMEYGAELEAAAELRSRWKRTSMTLAGGCLSFAGITVESHKLYQHLIECE